MMETKSNQGIEPENKSAPEAEQKKELSVEELTDLLQRTQANFENYRKQTQTYIEEIKKMAARDIVLQVLPVLDNFELALKAVPQDQENTDFVQGIKLINSQLLRVLQHNNILPIETLNKNFDPFYHEALMKVPSEAPANRIIEEFQRGYIMHGRVLRHAKVKISAGKKREEENKMEEKNKFYSALEIKEKFFAGQKQRPDTFEAGGFPGIETGHQEEKVHENKGAGAQPRKI